MMTKTHQEYLAIMQDACARQPLAFRWFCQALEAALLWDHVIDADPVDRNSANLSMAAMTLEWINNEWYYQNRTSLTPVIVNCMAAWKFANLVDENEPKSYDAYTELATTVLFLVGGLPAVEKHSVALRQVIERERFEDLRRDNPPFFIIGLPRSRTAWLAAFLTDGPVHCHHELVRNLNSTGEYLKAFHATKAPIIGDASPMMLELYPHFREQIGPHKVVIIRRHPADARESYRVALEEAGVPATSDERWKEIEQAFATTQELCRDAMTFRFQDLENPGCMKQLSEYCTGRPFNEARWKMFDEFQITAIPAKVIANQKLIK